MSGGLAEGQAHGLVDGDLHDAFDVIFDGVFGGEQLGVNGVYSTQAGIEGGGFAAAGWAGGNENDIWPLNGFGDVIVNKFRESERFDFQVDC